VSDRFDVAIIGSGPAGLAAARQASELGLDFVLLDEQRKLGGNVYRNYEHNAAERSDLADVLGADYLAASLTMSTEFLTPENRISGSQVFSIDPNGEVAYKKNRQVSIVTADKILIVTGAMERPTPVPGWTLPGVMSVGAAQTLLKSSALVPKGRSVFVGSGPLTLLVAHQYLKLGNPPAAIVFTGPLFGHRAPARSMFRALRFSGRLAKGFAWLIQLLLSKVDVYTNACDVEISGDSRATQVHFHSKSKTISLPADGVFLHEGVVPDSMLAMSANCEYVWNSAQKCWGPKLDGWGKTTVESIYVAGDSAGILGAHAAAPSAQRAVLSIAADLGYLDQGERDRQGAAPGAALKREQDFREFLDSVFPPPSQPGNDIPDQTIVCRCESVTAGQIRALAELDCANIGQAKAYTRCGMGPCQGRMCGLSVAQIIADSQKKRIEDIGHFRGRTPIRQITLGDLAIFSTNKGFSILDREK